MGPPALNLRTEGNELIFSLDLVVMVIVRLIQWRTVHHGWQANMSHSTRARLTPCHPGRTDLPKSYGVSETAQKPNPNYRSFICIHLLILYIKWKPRKTYDRYTRADIKIRYYLKLKLILKSRNVLLVLKYYIYNLIVVKNVWTVF